MGQRGIIVGQISVSLSLTISSSFSLLIRAASTEIASSLYTRDERRTEEGKTIPKEILPLRRVC